MSNGGSFQVIQELTATELKARETIKNSNPPHLAEGNLRIDQFFDLLFYLLEINQPNVYFAPAFPRFLIPGNDVYKRTLDNPTKLFLDTITYRITRESCGSVGGNKQPFGETRELTPKLRRSVIKDGKEINIYGQWFDTLVQFDIWSLTNREADRLTLWFKRFMMKSRDYLKHMGLSEILFWWRGDDEVVRQLRSAIHSRTLVYYVRTEEIMTSDDVILKELKYEVT